MGGDLVSLTYLQIFQDYTVQPGETADPYDHMALPAYLTAQHYANPTLGLWVGSSLCMRKLGVSPYTREQTWTQVNGGSMDATWTLQGQRAQALVNGVRPPPVFRGPHELDLGQWHYSPTQGDATDIAAWKGACGRYRNLIKAQCPTAIIEVNVVTSAGLGGNNHSFDTIIPPAGSFDRLAIDSYDLDWNNLTGCNWRPGIDAPPNDTKLAARWQAFLGDATTGQGLRYLRRRAVELGKSISMPEVGTGAYLFNGAYSTGGGDNPFYVNGLADFVFDPAYPAGSGAPGCVDILGFWEDGSESALGTPGENGIMPRTLIGKPGEDTDRFMTDSSLVAPYPFLVPRMRAAFYNRFVLGNGPHPAAPGVSVVAAATAITSSGFTSTWAAVPAATSYLVRRRTGTNAFFTVAIVTGTSAVHAGLAASTAYDVQVIARTGTTEGVVSNTVTTTTSATVAPGTPVSYTVVWTSPTTVATMTRPAGTYYRLTDVTAGSPQAQSSATVLVPASTSPTPVTFALLLRTGAGANLAGGVSVNVLDAGGVYMTNVSAGPGTPTLTASMTSYAYTLTVPAGGRQLVLLPYFNSAVPGDAVDLDPTVTLTASTPTAADPYGTMGSYKPGPTTSGVPSGITLRAMVAGDIPVGASWNTTTAILTVTGANVVMPEGLIIAAKIDVQAAGFRCRKSKLTGRNGGVQEAVVMTTNAAASDALFEDCELVPAFPSVLLNGFQGGNVTIRRCKVHDVVDAFSPQGPSVVIEACYAYDPAYFTPDASHPDNQSHNDSVQIQPGATGWMIRWNTLLAVYGHAGSNGAGTVSNVTGPTPAGAATPAISAFMFGANLTAANTPGGGDIIDNWIGGGYQPVNGGADHPVGAGINMGRILRNRFDANSLGGPTPGTAVHTVDLDATAIATTGDSTADQNIFEATGLAVTVRRNQ